MWREEFESERKRERERERWRIKQLANPIKPKTYSSSRQAKPTTTHDPTNPNARIP